MQVILHDAKTQFSRYVDQARPRLGGFLSGQANISADLKADFKEEIEEMFTGS